MSLFITAEKLKGLTGLPLAGVGVVYLFGFVIVSIFDSTYGIADFSFFRTKVIAAGALFLVLVAISVFVTFRLFSIMGLTVDRHGVPPPAVVVVTDENKFFVIADRVLFIPYASVVVVYPLLFLFKRPPPLTLLLLIAPAVWAALTVIGRKYFSKHPLPFVVVSGLNSIGFLIVLFKYAYREYFWFVVWFSFVGGFTVYLYFKITDPDPDTMRRTEWERVFMFAVPAIFGLYAAKVYPGFRTQYGGGAPVPIILHFTKKLPVFDSENVSVSLVDETEQGYYLIRSADSAVFVARGLVDEVEFLQNMPGSADGFKAHEQSPVSRPAPFHVW